MHRFRGPRARGLALHAEDLVRDAPFVEVQLGLFGRGDERKGVVFWGAERHDDDCHLDVAAGVSRC